MDRTILVTDGVDDDASVRRMNILKRNLELMEHQFVLSNDKDIAFLIWELSPQMTLPADVLAFAIKSLESNTIPTQVIQASRWSIYKILRKFQRELHRADPRNSKESHIVEQLTAPAKAHHFWAVVVAQKGKQAVEISAPASE